jgi:hypothetical protein
MPQYQFKVRHGGNDDSPIALDLPSLTHAKIEAGRTIGELMRTDTLAFWDGGECQISVSDAAGLDLFQIMVVALDSPAIGGRVH